MAEKVNFTSKSLLDLKFTKDVHGYDPLEVDQCLDQIIADLVYYENYKVESSKYIEKLEKENRELSEKLKNQEIELAKMRNRLSDIVDNPNAKGENIKLIKYIAALEKEVYFLGGNPTKIKY